MAVQNETARQVSRAVNIFEDESMEVNPYVFMKKDERGKVPTRLLAVGTEYSPEYMRYVDSNPFYMGHRFIINDIVEGNQVGDYNFPPAILGKETIIERRLLPQHMQTQALQNIRGLLTLPDYIKSRIIDLALSINQDESVREIEIDKIPVSPLKDLHISNIRNFVRNNSWTFYSDDRSAEFHIFCPIISSHGRKYTLKFLRLTQRDIGFDIYPFIYSITLVDGAQSIQVTTPEGDVIKFCIELGSKLDMFPRFLKYYNHLDQNRYETLWINIPNSNPDDCAVVSTFMAGMITQPDMTRYHNLFRDMKIYDNDVTRALRIEHMLSYGYPDFSISIMTRRINSFYNRVDPKVPLRDLIEVKFLIGGEKYNYDYTETIYGVEYQRDYTYPNMYSIEVIDDTKSRDENYKRLVDLLDQFGCNKENVLFPMFVIGHQLLLSYKNGRYIMRDPQVNLYYDDQLFNHPNHFDTNGNMQGHAHISILCAKTDLKPANFSIICPEMPTLYEYYHNTPNFKGDPFPLVRNTINKFITHFRTHRTRPIYLAVDDQKRVEDSFVFDLSIKDVTMSRLYIEAEKIDLESLGLMQHPNPQISFDYYNRMTTSIQRVIENLSDYTGIKVIRNFITGYNKLHSPDILQRYLGRRYDDKDIYNFLLSRPLFAAFLREYITKGDDGVSNLSAIVSRTHSSTANQLIAGYLSQSVKPVLPVVGIFYKRISSAGTIKALAKFRNSNLSSLVKFTENISPFIGDDLEEGLKTALEQYGQIYNRTLVEQAKERIRNRIAIVRVLLPKRRLLQAREVDEFFRINPKLLPKHKEDFKGYRRKETFIYKPVNEEILQRVIYKRLVNQLNYTPRDIESRFQVSRNLMPRIYGEQVRAPVRLIPLPSSIDYDEKIKELEEEYLQERIRGVYEEPEEKGQVAERRVSDYIDVMIQVEQSLLMDDTIWTDSERRQLQEEIDAIPEPDASDRLDAFDVFVSIINILRSRRKDIDDRYLGRKK